MKQGQLDKPNHHKESHRRHKDVEDFPFTDRNYTDKHSYQDQRNRKHQTSHHHDEKTKSKLKVKSDVSRSDYKNAASEINFNSLRNTDSNTNSSDDCNNPNNKCKKKRKRKRNHREDSYEALSDRKKMIELELQALDVEEARQVHRRKKIRNDSHHHKEDQMKSVRIKREPITDDESNNRAKREYNEAHFSHAKQNSASDDDQRRHRNNFSNEHRSVKIKQEFSDDDERWRKRSVKYDHKSHSVKIKHESTNDIENNHSHFRVDNRNNSARIKHEPDTSPHSGHRNRVNPRRGNTAATSDAENMEWGRPDPNISVKKEKEAKEKPNFATSGKLAEDTNTFNGVVIKYNEPAEARKPRRRWRLYPFKGDDSLPFIPIHRQSAYLLGRSRLIADIPVDHPSCSKQHAVLQFRLTPYTREDGTKGRNVKPYIIDLDSANGTFLNNNKVEPRRYMELVERDVLKFGFSSRVYVILHEESRGAEEEDDEGQIEESPS